MIDLKFDFDKKQIDKIAKQLKEQIEDAVQPLEKEVAEEILKEAQKNCPVDTGELKRSGFVKKVSEGYTVGFGAEYAMIVHEQPQSYRENGKRHFLSDAVEKVAGKNGEKLKERLVK